MKKVLTLLLTALIIAGVSPAESQAKTSRRKKSRIENQDTVKKESDYEKFLKKNPETHKGFITLYKEKGKVYFEFPLSLQGRDMLIGSTVSEISDNGDALIGSKPMVPLHVTFSKVGNKMNLVQVSKDYITDSKRDELLKALDKNSAGSIIASFKIDYYNQDSTAVVFDMTDFFVSDQKSMRPFDEYSMNTYMGRAKRMPEYQSDKSFLGDVKAFEGNVSVKSYLSYKYSISYAGKDLAENVPFTALMTRSIILLDEKPYKPRPVDSRIGIFPTGKILFSEKAQQSEIVYFANRWRIEPSDTAAYRAGNKVDPVKPIVFYIDPAFPEDWKPAIFEAVNQWKEPFEKIGFTNAIEAREYPADDPEFDPDNIRYSCIRYAPIGIENAMGPSWVDPRSGEIINASVYVYHDVVKLVNNWRFIQTAQTDESVRSGVLPQDVLSDALRYVITHEVGHCLGLMHNMSASATVPVDSLRSPSFTSKYGTTHSIMDYARFNYVAQPGDMQKGVKLTPPKFGLYDYFTIKYSYTPVFDAADLQEEAEIVSGWLTEAQADPILRYGKQQMAVMDPRSQNEDLGDDAVKASEYGISNLKYILPNINTWIKDDKDFSYRTEIYTGIIYQYLTYIQHVYANIGGLYLYEKYDGDPIEYAYSCVPRDIQKDAFDFLCRQVKDLTWLDNEELMKNIQIMGTPSKTFQAALVQAIVMSPWKIASRQMMRHDEEIYTVSECLKDVYDLVWAPTVKGKTLTDLDMMFQREYVKTIFALAGFKYTGTGAVNDSRSLTDNSNFAIAVPEFLKEYETLGSHVCSCSGCAGHASGPSPVAGYSSPYTMFVAQPLFDAEYYTYAMKVKKLIEQKVNSATGDTKAHYELILRNIQKTLK
ncbi:MAG: zinc-dependent metalloprotease [Bacteroidales bacterium]|nr:zinc-dependent metalloprotease [Bacteroidales bacterium]